MVKTRMAKSVHDAGWAQFIRVLEEKALENDRELHRADTFFPSSQICAACGERSGKKPLHVRAWKCANCGAHLDRDYNAATNLLMLADGQPESQNACGQDVRLQLAAADLSEAGTHRTDRLTQSAA